MKREIRRSEAGLWLVWEQAIMPGRPRADGTRATKWVIDKVFASRARAEAYVRGVK